MRKYTSKKRKISGELYNSSLISSYAVSKMQRTRWKIRTFAFKKQTCHQNCIWSNQKNLVTKVFVFNLQACLTKTIILQTFAIIKI